MRLLKAWLRSLGLLEKRCRHCLEPFTPQDDSDLLCPECLKGIHPYAGSRCRLCGVPQPANTPQPCAECAANPPPWQNIAYYGLYEGVLRDMLLRLKFDGELHLSRLLAEFLLDAANSLPRPDLLVALPQHSSRLKKRGFNQAHEIARSFSQMSGFALSPKILRRARAGIPQEGLSAMQRKQNVANAFQASAKARGRNIWLIDDIMTTGATAREASNALMNSGARTVSLLFVARTPRVI